VRRVFLLAACIAAAGCGADGAPVRVERAAPELDVSNARSDQSEVAGAAAPDGRTFLAGSNEYDARAERTYSSTDGGRSWTSRIDPPVPHPLNGCASDPAVAIDADGRQYYAFLEYTCDDERLPASLYVATRAEAGADWVTHRSRIGSVSSNGDDRPAIAADRSRLSPHRGRIYVAWARERAGIAGIVVSHSDDHGRAWSPPVTVNDLGANDYDASIAIGRHGEVYVAWLDLDSGAQFIDVAPDGITFGTDRTAAQFHGWWGRHCDSFGIYTFAQDRRCVRPNGSVSVDTSDGSRAGRVYFTYTDVTAKGGHDVFLTGFDSRLGALLGYAVRGRQHRVTRAENPRILADQFLPVSAVDEESGDLWICFYDTTGDFRRYSTRFSCVASRDGGRTFTAPFRAATTRSDETVAGGNTNQYGDFEGLVVADGLAHPFWTDTRRRDGSGDEIFTTTLRLTTAP
jgi:hypothetical protein